VLGDDHPATVLTTTNLASTLRALGLHQQADHIESGIRPTPGPLPPAPHDRRSRRVNLGQQADSTHHHLAGRTPNPHHHPDPDDDEEAETRPWRPV
jgi:hypothetical protein